MPTTSTQSSTTVNIRPDVGMLSVLSHLNYRPWFAMAEFVDNSLQSFLEYRIDLERIEGPGFSLPVTIEIDPADGGRITIRDSAAGIHLKDFPRAFRPAAVPPNRDGLSEFGMGMKSAACWFGRRWSVRTSALGEPVERVVNFDIEAIVRDVMEELTVTERPADPGAHYTEIMIWDLNRLPQTKTLGKIREHLASIYRVFLRRRDLTLRFNREVLRYESPKILSAPFFKDPDGPPIEWTKQLDLDLGLGTRVNGFAALRATASVSHAGFALFRHDRLIEGSADDGYRPEYIFGKSNSYRYQRLFGELHLSGFEVSHTKDGFRWEEHEDIFLELLKEELDRQPVPLLTQAEGYRSRPRVQDLRGPADTATTHTAETIQRHLRPVVEQQLAQTPDAAPPPVQLGGASLVSHRVISVAIDGSSWELDLELSNDPSIGEWVELSDQPTVPTSPGQPRRVGVRIALAHPFMRRFVGADQASLEPLLRVGVAIALAELTARASGVRSAGTIRRNVNSLLRDVLSKT